MNRPVAPPLVYEADANSGNVISLSGGKDSTAMALLAIERGVANLHFLFADTGHEHPLTYEYIDYLDGVIRARLQTRGNGWDGQGIVRLRADFSEEIERKRRVVAECWPTDLTQERPGRWRFSPRIALQIAGRDAVLDLQVDVSAAIADPVRCKQRTEQLFTALGAFDTRESSRLSPGATLLTLNPGQGWVRVDLSRVIDRKVMDRLFALKAPPYGKDPITLAEVATHLTLNGQATPTCPDQAPPNPYHGEIQGCWEWEPAVRGLTPQAAQERVARALAALHPTGIPFLDLCLARGRFPSTKARFCTQELKHFPLDKHIGELMQTRGYQRVWSWQGIRADESAARAGLAEVEDLGGFGVLAYRPLLRWTVEQVFAQHRRHNVRWNPLYERGMKRVGCMPCIHAGKDEVFAIAQRYPEEIDRVREWEHLVSDASKRGISSFFPASKTPGEGGARSRIDDVVAWSQTSRGGTNLDAFRVMDMAAEAPACSSVYGLCE